MLEEETINEKIVLEFKPSLKDVKKNFNTIIATNQNNVYVEALLGNDLPVVAVLSHFGD